jgi:hypothetical protein
VYCFAKTLALSSSLNSQSGVSMILDGPSSLALSPFLDLFFAFLALTPAFSFFVSLRAVLASFFFFFSLVPSFFFSV